MFIIPQTKHSYSLSLVRKFSWYPAILILGWTNFQMNDQNFLFFVLFLMSNFENVWKYTENKEWPKPQNCFTNTLASKYLLKMVQYSKQTFFMSHYKWDRPQPCRLNISREIRQTITKSFQNTFPRFLLHFSNIENHYMVGVCFHLKHDIHRYILNINPFSRDICGLIYW